jgi:pimeloyl-ACP methyl ester carboxylesterase
VTISELSEASLHPWTASDGVELAYHETGEGRPVILMHGLFSSAQMNWIKFGHADRIARDGFRVIMPDLRTHGESGKPHDPATYAPDILVRDLKELIAHLSLGQFDLGGFSLGARTTIDAVSGGVQPRRAILAGTGLDVLTNWDRRCRFFVQAIERFDEARRGDPHWLSIQFMRTMKVDLVAAELLLKALGDHPSTAQAIAAFTMPTLVVCGSEDDENGSARELAAALPAARYEEIPGTHMSSVTKPDLGEAIASFLTAV